MIPKRLLLSGFLSYRDEVEIDFSQLHLACIAGSNGAGKSTLLDAITWSLFGQARKRDDSLINSASNAAQVLFEFEYEGNNYRVLRSKKRDQPTLLEFHLLDPGAQWRPLTCRTMRETEAAIQGTLHLDYDTFVSAAFFLQGKADQFTQQRPAERKRILGSILGLDSWEGYRQTASDQRRSEETELAVLDGRLNAIRGDLGTKQDRQAAVQRLKAQLQEVVQQREQQEAVVAGLQRTRQMAQGMQDRKAALARQLEEARVEEGALQTRLRERKEELEGYQSLLERKDEVDACYRAWEANRAEADRLSEMAARAHALELQQHTLRSEERERRVGLEQELAAHEKRLQELQSLIDQEAGTLQAKAALERALEEAQHVAERQPQLESGHREALRQRGELLSEIPRLRQEMDELKERIDRLQVVDEAGCPLCEQALSVQARKDLTERLTGQGGQLGDRYRENKRLLKDIEARIATLETESRKVAAAAARLERHALEAEQLSSRLAEIQGARDEIKDRIEPGIDRAREALTSGHYAGEIREQLERLKEESDGLGYDLKRHEAVREALKDLQGAPADMRKLEQADAAVRSLGREIADLERQDKSLSKQVSRLEQDEADLSGELARLEQELSHVQESERLLSDLRRRENETRKQLGAAEKSLADLAALRQTLDALQGERQERATRVQRLRRLEVAFGHKGVPALLIEQALPEIEARANEIIGLLSDGAMSIRLVTQQAYKDQSRQDMRETLDVLISDGQGLRDYSLFSGGERFRVDFAIRLALSKVLAQRAGARLQMLVIDEGFGSQDEIGRQKLVEAVNLVQGDFGCILVITHIDALKDVFPARMEVSKTPQGSIAQVL